MQHLVVIGGGIAGLSVARALRRQLPAEAARVIVLERADRPGGLVRSEVVDGYLCESGPSGFLDNAPATMALVRDLGLQGRLLPSRDLARRRFVVRGGRLLEIPASVGQFFLTPLLSWRGKLRLLLEPLASRGPEGDESIEAFAVRRLGREAATMLIEPMVAGIFGGDARELSMAACFPRLKDLERRHGSLIGALVSRRLTAAVQSARTVVSPRGSRHARASVRLTTRRSPEAGPDGPTRRSPKPAIGAPLGRLLSFAGGMSDLVRALCDELGDAVRLRHRVVSVRAVPPLAASGYAPGCRYLVDVEGVGRLQADVVVLTGPAAESAAILSELDPTLAAWLQGIPTVSLAVVYLGYDEATLAAQGVRLHGFGFLVPRDEPPRVLGVLWESSIYPGRAPAGKVLLRAILGGARDPWAVHLDDEALVGIVRRDLTSTMQIAVAPEFVRIVRHRVGLPQYTLGHLDRLAAIEKGLARHPGLFLSGHAYRGVGVNACIAEAEAVAERVLAYLRSLGSETALARGEASARRTGDDRTSAA